MARKRQNWALTAGSTVGILFLLLVCCLRVSAEQLPVRIYTEMDGLPHKRVRCMMRDSQGFLWFCVSDRLSRFDGQRFATYEIGLETTGIVEGSAGVYWVGTYGRGVYRFSIGASPAGSKPALIAYATGSEPDSNLVNVVYRDRSGKIWAGTDNGLYVLDEGNGKSKFQRVELGIESPPGVLIEVGALTEDHHGNLWIGSADGPIRRLASGQMIHYVGSGGEKVRFVRALMCDRDGRLWIGHNGGVIVLNPERSAAISPASQFSRRFLSKPDHPAPGKDEPIVFSSVPGSSRWFSTADGTATQPVWALRQYPDGLVLAATMGGGIYAFESGAIRHYTTANGLSENSAWSLGEDVIGNRWIGTMRSGAIRLARGGFTTYGDADGWSNAARVLSIFQTVSEDICIVGTRWQIAYFNGSRFENVPLRLPPASVSSPSAGQYLHPVIQDRAGEWWVATGQGVYRFPRVKRNAELANIRAKSVYTTQHGLASNLADALFEDSRGDVWISAGSRVGQVRAVLCKWERETGAMRTYTKANGLPPLAAPVTFAEDARGNVWMGLWNAGLLRYDGSRFLELNEGEGVPRGGAHSLFRDSAGRLWAAVYHRGIVRIDEPAAARPHVAAYTTSNGLSSNDATCFTEDRSGRIYIGTSRGIDRFDPATGRFRSYGTADGLRGGNVTAAFRDRHGVLWFATSEGIARFVPGSEAPAVSPQVLISSLRISGFAKPVPELGASQIAPLRLVRGEDQIRVEFFALSFRPGDVLRYQYKLEGSEKPDWSLPSEQSSVDFAKLAAGRYKFSVRAINADGLTSQAPATAEFTIPPPVWRTWWFLSLATGLLSASAYQFHRYRLSRATELERVRTRIASDLHDDIGSTLSQISVLSEVVRQKVSNLPAVEETLTNMGNLSRDLLDSLNEIVWAINPNRDSLQDLTQRMRRLTNDFVIARSLEYSFRAPAVPEHLKIGTDLRREVFLIFKESVNNAVRHSGCKHLEIEFLVKGGWVELQVKDDGKGFDTAQVSDGNGLWNMHRRAATLGGKLAVESREGQGTTVCLRVPLHRRSWAWRR